MAEDKKSSVKKISRVTTPKCLICHKDFRRISTMLRHMRNIHKEKTDNLTVYKPKIACCKCDSVDAFTCQKLNQLQKHMQEHHNIQFKVENHVFSSENDFLEWKCHVEKETISRYVQACGAKKSGATERRQFYCSRSGFYKPKGTKKYALKKQGSSKINTTCPSYINVISTKSGPETTIKVEYVGTHVGHRTELGHLTLDKTDRELIAAKLLRGCDMNSILSSLRNCHNGSVQRINLTTRKDLLNIKAALKTNKTISEGIVYRCHMDSWLEEIPGNLPLVISEDSPMPEEATSDESMIVPEPVYCDDTGSVVESELSKEATDDECMIVPEPVYCDDIGSVAEAELSTNDDDLIITTEDQVQLDRLRSCLIKDAELTIKKFKQAQTLGQLIAMTKMYKSINPSLDLLLKSPQHTGQSSTIIHLNPDSK